jgi:hypothetical protein
MESNLWALYWRIISTGPLNLYNDIITVYKESHVGRDFFLVVHSIWNIPYG